jgi:glutamine amidotransferase|tara:strand:+ start:25 stop:660 length:636 start_codon:yes stop_codon:yes gene_type:complete
MIAIIDYQMSNLFSVKNALEYLGIDSEITSDVTKIMAAKGAILPGVGAFAEAMKHLKTLDLIQPIKDFINSGKPFMGICLGFHLLFTESEEFGVTRGMDILQGKVESFSKHVKSKKIPHIGWNRILTNNDVLKEDSFINPLKDINSDEYMYFVHSFYVDPDNKDIIATETEYDSFTFCSSVLKGNVFASQFHPEKSGTSGLKILKNYFLSL